MIVHHTLSSMPHLLLAPHKDSSFANWPICSYTIYGCTSCDRQELRLWDVMGIKQGKQNLIGHLAHWGHFYTSCLGYSSPHLGHLQNLYYLLLIVLACLRSENNSITTSDGIAYIGILCTCRVIQSVVHSSPTSLSPKSSIATRPSKQASLSLHVHSLRLQLSLLGSIVQE